VCLLQQDCYLASGNFAAPLVRDRAASSVWWPCAATEAKRANRQRVRVGGKGPALRTLADGHMQPVFLLMAKLEKKFKIK
jgi:hypothetical protein